MSNNYAVFFKDSQDGESVYRSYEADSYKKDEIVAVFGTDYEAAKWFASNFKGYSENGIFEVCGVHQSAQPGHDSRTFWRDQLPPEVAKGWIAYGRRIDPDQD